MVAGKDLVLNDYDYAIEGGGYIASDDPRSIGARFLNTLNDLGQNDPIFSNWLLTDTVKLKQVKLAAVRDNIAALVENNVNRDDDDQPDPDEGYYMCAFNSPVGGPRTVSFSVVAGRRTVQTFDLQFGRQREGVDASLVNYPLFKAALLTIVANNPCEWATATGFKIKLRHVPDGPAIRVETESFHRLTWLAYLTADRTKGLELPPDMVTERTPDGGLLMIAAQERPDPSNVAQMKRADLLTTIMAERGRDPHQ